VLEQLGTLGPVAFLDRPGTTGASRVVHVRDSRGGSWYAKRLTKRWLWERETSAYRLWQDVPGVPVPRAVCSETQCLLLPEVPGRQPRGQSRRVLRTAGRLLRALHAEPPPEEWASSWRDLVPRDVEKRLAGLSRMGVIVDSRMVTRYASQLVGLDVPEVASHGDFQPHNWRLHRGELFVFDFARAGRRPAAFDLGRLMYAACWRQTGAFLALVKGYGRQPSPAECQFLTAMLPWRAVVAMHMGGLHNRPEMVEHGRRVLEAVVSGDHWSM